MVSLLSLCYNIKPDALKRFFQSVMDNSYGEYEHVIFDDCSTDPGTLEVLDWYIKTNPNARILNREKENKHIMFGVNKLINSAKGDWVWIVDSDDEILPNSMLNLVHLASQYSKCSLIISDNIYHYENNSIPDSLHSKYNKYFSKPTLMPTKNAINGLMHGQFNFYSWLNFFVKKDVIIQASIYNKLISTDRKDFKIFQDWLLCVSCINCCSEEIVINPIPTCKYHMYGNGVTNCNIDKKIDSCFNIFPTFLTYADKIPFKNFDVNTWFATTSKFCENMGGLLGNNIIELLRKYPEYLETWKKSMTSIEKYLQEAIVK